MACTEAQIRLVGEGLLSFLGFGPAQELTAAGAVLRGELVPALEGEAALKRVFAAIDQWVLEAARDCEARDPQLDLHDALPPQLQPVHFVRKTERVAV